ncbi:MAG: ThiS family [Thermosediminibacterales bacterium]|nr:ThiS family [Thermosediminibacterales bacterium]
MKVKVKLFFKLADISSDTVEVELEDGATIMSVIEKLSILYGSELEKQIYDAETGSCIVEFIVNQKHEMPSKQLKDGDEIAILPFVVGG